MGSGKHGADSQFNEFTLKPNEILKNGSTELIYRSDGNLVVISRIASNKILWSTETTGKKCINQCVAEFKDGFLSLKENGVIYWTTATAGKGSRLQLSRRFPYITIVNDKDSVWPLIKVNQTLSLGPNFRFKFKPDGNVVEEFKNTAPGDTSIYTIWESKTTDHQCSTNCYGIFQPNGSLKLYKDGAVYWKGKPLVF